MAKILLIQPNYDIREALRWKNEAWMPLALSALATYVKSKNSVHEFVIYDRNIHYDNNELLKLLKISQEIRLFYRLCHNTFDYFQ